MEIENKKRTIFNRAVIGLLIMCLLTIGGILGVELRASAPDWPALLHDIFLSVVCSVAASAIYALLQVAVSRDEQEELKALKAKIESMDDKLRMQKDLYDSGIVSIRKKSYYDPNGKFWNDMIESTSERLDLIGHSISRWFDEEFKDIFVKKVQYMLKHKKEVRIILSGEKPDFEKIHQVEQNGGDKPQLNKIEKTCYELRQIVKGTPEKCKKHLQVYLTEPSKVTYMYIRTDHQCFISPYISSVSNSSSAFLLELETKVDYSKCFELDFTEMLGSNLFKIDLEQ